MNKPFLEGRIYKSVALRDGKPCGLCGKPISKGFYTVICDDLSWHTTCVNNMLLGRIDFEKNNDYERERKEQKKIEERFNKIRKHILQGGDLLDV